MNLQEREDLHLLLLRDATETQAMWLDRWAVSYPQVVEISIDRTQAPHVWQQQIQAAFAAHESHPIMVVAHGAACAGFGVWLFHSGMHEQKRIKAAILAAPVAAQWQQEHADILQRARCNFPTALVVGEQDAQCHWEQAQAIAQTLGARALQTPVAGHLNGTLLGWQWGMKLMQAMILA